MEEMRLELERIREELDKLIESIHEAYLLLREDILTICEEARNEIYISQYEFECMLDLLLGYGCRFNIKEEFELFTNTYTFIYPDSVAQFNKKYSTWIEQGIISE